jgi:DNA-binding protein YbaB
MPDIAAQHAGEAAVASFVAEARTMRAKTEAALDALTTTTATASSDDGAVSATVTTTGELTGLSFDPAATGYGRETLATTVLATTRRAQVQAVEQAERRLSDIVGADNPAVAVLRRELAAEHVPQSGPRLVPPEDDEPVPDGD